MAKVTVVFSMDNAGFQDHFNLEVNNLMSQISSALFEAETTLENGFQHPLHDTNGNKVGHIELDDE